MHILVGDILDKDKCMKRFYLPIVCLMGTVILCMLQAASSEFVQPKKQLKQTSVDTLKQCNIERCSVLYDSAANLIEGLGRFQKQLKQCIDRTLQEETRAHHEKIKPNLEKAVKMLKEMEEFLETSEDCLKNSV